jgi:hypothetical protein
MTEDEAKTKWCPFVRAQLTEGEPSYNATPEARVGQCIASGCMAWRWGERLETEREAYMRGTDLRRTLQSTTDGFCGLVGKP